MSGLPGAGKTTLLTRAAAAGAVTVISRDLIRAAMFPGPAPHTPEETGLAFEAMLVAAGARLRTGESVALDGCCFARPGQRQRALELADAAGARLVGVHLGLPAATAIRRVATPGGPHPANDRDAALVARVAAYLAPPEPDDLVIDARRPAEEIWALVRHRLAAAGAPGGSRGTGNPDATIVA
ncbi:MAG: hypothetical protein QOE27_2789 [Solirubrobacteraceae bacterium]|nr:hypothetical protein [Solirubrobacteraceae bacterium]